MSPLRNFAQTRRLSELARRTGASVAQISRIAAGKSRPSPELARRIETATDGEVTAASLLGLAPERRTSHRRLSDGRWSLIVGEDGSVILPAEILAAFGFGPGETLVLKAEGAEVRLASSDKAIAGVQAIARALPRTGSFASDELIAERRVEGAREAID